MNPDPTSTPPAETGRPFYGWRYVPRQREDGTTELQQVDLTLEDVLHPQEGDVIPERPLHELERRYLSEVFNTRKAGLNRGLILSDCLVDWGVPEIRNHSPDISVFADLEEMPDPREGTFHLEESGGRCVLVIELVSPDTRNNDVVHKFAEYHQVGVPLYVIVDEERPGAGRKLLAYEHTEEGYAPLRLTERDRVEIPPLGICLGLGEERVVCYDTITGEELGDYQQVIAALDAAEQKAEEEAKARKKAERKAARAERKAQKEAEARVRAEREARERADALAVAEKLLAEAQERARIAEEALNRARSSNPPEPS
jgi:Uma2 family endonuclease